MVTFISVCFSTRCLLSFSCSSSFLGNPLAVSDTFAEREHRKWTENAIPLHNNPYSRENIERRLMSRSNNNLNGGGVGNGGDISSGSEAGTLNNSLQRTSR